MFLENNLHSDNQRGWVEVIAGSMFSGKTEELIRRLKRARIAQQAVAIFKPQIDTRYSAVEVVSHDANAVESVPVATAAEILELCGDVRVVGIDEGQFFDANLVDVCNKLANEGKRVIVAGLDMDFRGVPFGPMPALMAVAEYVTKVHAICVQCGELANHSYRITKQDSLVLLGEKDSYLALCRACFVEAQQAPTSE
ncbi:MAG: hypothetical protein RIS47_1501 [Bacteroidota bacterium]|jgi:thymidine kinase